MPEADIAYMPRLEKSVVTLRVFGDDLVPAEVSEILQAKPSSAHRKGEHFQAGARTLERKSGSWRLRAADTEPENFDNQVTELLANTTGNLDAWAELAQRFRVDLFCGWFMGSGNEGLAISPTNLAALGARGITLSIDLYGPETEPDSDLDTSH